MIISHYIDTIDLHPKVGIKLERLESWLFDLSRLQQHQTNSIGKNQKIKQVKEEIRRLVWEGKNLLKKSMTRDGEETLVVVIFKII
jgi:hypothetical protein